MDDKEIYSRVNTFSDLLETNLKFFKGELEETYYYGAPWGKGEDQNDHVEVATENLIQLTEKHRIFTTNGQSSYSDKVTDQRSYLICYMEKGTFERVKYSLLNDNRIWVIFFIKKENKTILDYLKSMFEEGDDYEYYELSSLEKKKTKIVLTLDCGSPYSIWRRSIEERYENESNYENIKNIIKDSVYCLIVCKEWNKEPTADRILLDHLDHLDRLD